MNSCSFCPAEKAWHRCVQRIFGCVMFFIYLVTGNAQVTYHLQIFPLGKDISWLKKQVEFKTTFSDTALVFNELNSILAQLHDQAFLEASFDSTAWGSSDAGFPMSQATFEIPIPASNILSAWLHIGERWEWLALRNGNVELSLLERSGYRERLFQKKPFNHTEIKRLKERLLEQAENAGYPFAKVWISDFGFRVLVEGASKSEIPHLKSQIEAALFLEKGKLFFFDTLAVTGDVKISKAYLRNYLGVKPGEPYMRRKVLKIRERLRELPFLQEKSSAVVTFRNDRATVNLNLSKKKASRFDFLLGILPDNRRTGNKVLLTGTFNAEMQNQFGLGERIFAAFERLRPQTQKLELAFAYPYLLDLPFGVEVKFNQFKRDSTYSDVAGEGGVQYLFEGGNYLKAFWNVTASRLLEVDTFGIRQGRFPDQLDVKNSSFGLEGNWQRLDYRFNPRRGWNLLLRASAGIRKIQQNQAILNVAENFYDTLQASSFRFQVDATVEKYLPLMQRSTLKTAIRSGGIFSEKPVYQNEQYRLGGNRLLRGFDEESIFATFFSVFTAEYRLLVGQNSFFYLFGDYGYVENRRFGKTNRFDRLLGFGAGITFETSAGVFGISVATGGEAGAAVSLRNPKIHFGYVSYF